ncbi:DMT family transporter [Myroides pelagicus]|uniref:EamA family transporter n=1 Tax=Myroides pelagicus TaxID=270914 RepID=A0A7K1GMU5_9FLAO|nr:DMT family transporter [Myroides pelagicus]MEC4114553.1 DMT family transporter [Myroides pelagicus]MTH30176.1 EamA family transporter [Myroides pelagicus]
MQEGNIRSYIYLHLIVFVWGFTAILGQLITLDALPLVWYRILIAVLTLGTVFLFTKQSLKVSKNKLIQFLAAGVVIALHWLTFFWAIKVSNISITLACLSTGAFFASILEPIILKRKIDLVEMILGVVVIGALALIFSVSLDHVFGIVLGLIAASLSALFSIINSKLVKHSSPSIITFYEMVGGVLILSVFLLFTGGFTIEFFQVEAIDWFWLIVLGVFCTAFAFIGSVMILKDLSPFTVMLTINLEPVYGILLALLIFKDDEKMNATFYFAAALILSTVIINGLIKNRKRRKLTLK